MKWTRHSARQVAARVDAEQLAVVLEILDATSWAVWVFRIRAAFLPTVDRVDCSTELAWLACKAVHTSLVPPPVGATPHEVWLRSHALVLVLHVLAVASAKPW